MLGEFFPQHVHDGIVLEAFERRDRRAVGGDGEVMHDRAGAPSISTVHAPQTPCSQPICVAVRN